MLSARLYRTNMKLMTTSVSGRLNILYNTRTLLTKLYVKVENMCMASSFHYDRIKRRYQI